MGSAVLSVEIPSGEDLVVLRHRVRITRRRRADLGPSPALADVDRHLDAGDRGLVVGAVGLRSAAEGQGDRDVVLLRARLEALGVDLHSAGDGGAARPRGRAARREDVVGAVQLDLDPACLGRIELDRSGLVAAEGGSPVEGGVGLEGDLLSLRIGVRLLRVRRRVLRELLDDEDEGHRLDDGVDLLLLRGCPSWARRGRRGPSAALRAGAAEGDEARVLERGLQRLQEPWHVGEGGRAVEGVPEGVRDRRESVQHARALRVAVRLGREPDLRRFARHGGDRVAQPEERLSRVELGSAGRDLLARQREPQIRISHAQTNAALHLAFASSPLYRSSASVSLGVHRTSRRKRAGRVGVISMISASGPRTPYWCSGFRFSFGM